MKYFDDINKKYHGDNRQFLIMIKTGECMERKIEENYELPSVNPVLVLAKLKFQIIEKCSINIKQTDLHGCI